MFKLIITVVIIALALFIAGQQIFVGNWFSCVSILIVSLAMLLVIALGPCEARETPGFHILAGLGVAVGITAVFLEHRAFDVQLNVARTEALLAFAKGDKCQKQTGMLFKEGLRSCWLQGPVDQMEAIFDLQKELYLPTEVAFLDQIRADISQGSTDRCATIYIEVSKRCPEAFLGISHEADYALRAAGARK